MSPTVIACAHPMKVPFPPSCTYTHDGCAWGATSQTPIWRTSPDAAVELFHRSTSGRCGIYLANTEDPDTCSRVQQTGGSFVKLPYNTIVQLASCSPLIHNFIFRTKPGTATVLESLL
jgi:hypothetical protein